MSDMIKGYNASDELVYAGVNDNHELKIDSRNTVNRDTLIASNEDIYAADAKTVSSSIISLEALNFKREYRGLAIQTKFITLATGASVITGTLIFYNDATGTTELKKVSSAVVLTAKDQVELYNILPDDMAFKYMKFQLTESGGSGGHAYAESTLVY